jgi:hypothetical protein
MRVRRITNCYIWLCILFGVNSINAQIDTLTHIQYGYLYNKDIGTSTDMKNPKLRIIVLYKRNSTNMKAVDSLLDLKSSSIFNNDTFRVYLVELYKAPLRPEDAGVCPPASRLTFYGKIINHSVVSDGVWVLLDTTQSKLKPSYWETVKKRNNNLKFIPSAFADGLIEITNRGEFYNMITRPHYRVENLYRNTQQLQNEISNLYAEILNLRSELNASNVLNSLSRTTLLSISAQQNFLSFTSNKLPGLKDFTLDKLSSSCLELSLENRIPKESYSITREITIGFREVRGEIKQNGGTRNENLGYYMRGFTPYERIVYTNNLKEEFTLSFVSAGIGLGLRKELSTLDIFFKAGGTVFKSVSTNFNVQADAISFGGIFPEINPVDTIFSGVGDFYTNLKYSKKDGRIPIESTTLGLNLSLGADYWLSAERNIGIKAGMHYQQHQTIFSGTQSGLFSSTDLASYNPLVARLGNASMRGFGLSLGIVYKLQ